MAASEKKVPMSHMALATGFLRVIMTRALPPAHAAKKKNRTWVTIRSRFDRRLGPRRSASPPGAASGAENTKSCRPGLCPPQVLHRHSYIHPARIPTRAPPPDAAGHRRERLESWRHPHAHG